MKPPISLEQAIENAKKEIANQVYKARSYSGIPGDAQTDWALATAIIGNKDWRGTGRSYADVLRKHYEHEDGNEPQP